MFATIYWNANSTFKSMKMKKMFNDRDIICIFISNQFHKSVDMIERNNKIFKYVMNKMKKSNENFFDIFRRTIFVCNNRHIKHLKYIFNQILHNIEFFNFVVVRFVQFLQLFEKIMFFNFDEMLSLIWNHMIKREKIHKNVIKRMTKIKQRMKKRYDREIKFKLFVFDQYMFFRDINFILAGVFLVLVLG